MRLISKVFALAGATLFAVAQAKAPTKSGEPVLFGEGGTYPRAVRLADGSFLGVYADKRGGNSTLTTLKSTNNGATWDPIGTVTTMPSKGLDLDNPYVHQTPDGKILCGFRNHDFTGEGESRKYTHYRITVCISDDLGKTWRFQQQAEDYPAGDVKNGSWEPFMQTALDGSIQLYYSRENQGDDQDSILRRSTDNGKTWSDAQTISGADITARDGMLGVVPIAERSPEKLAIFETVLPGGTFMVWTVRTTDDGETWGGRSKVYENPGKNAGAPQIIRVGSRLVASFGVDEEGGVWPEGSLVVMVSEDNGKTWKDKTTMHPLPALWGGMLGLDDNSFLVFFASGGNTYAQKMIF